MAGGDIILKKTTKSLSKPEKTILKILRGLGERALFEVYFPWCREGQDRVRLPFDIVLPDKKVIIEYDGRQHYEHVKFFHKTKKAFHDAQKRDKVKERLAKKHGFTVVRIRYDEKVSELLVKMRLRQAWKKK